jgi:hypothetical protein
VVDQTWGDELFADGATAYGANPNLYVKVQPWTAQPETTTSRSLRVSNGVLTDAFQRALGQSSGVAGPVLRNLSGGAFGTNGDAVWVAERQNELANSNVSFAPALYPIFGTPDNDCVKQFGVCSHVSGGTFVTATSGSGRSDDYYTAVSGLFLIEAKETVTRHRVLLLRLVAGAITVLGDEEVRVTDAVHAQGTGFDFFRPGALRLNVQEDGVLRQVRAYRTDLTGVERPLFTAGTFAISGLADGRCGFGLQTRRVSSGGCDSVGVCNLFTIRTQDNSSLLFADTFERSQVFTGRELPSAGLAGFSLSAAWTGDGEGSTSSESSSLLRRDTVSADRIVAGRQNNLGNSGFGTPGFHVHQIPPASTEQRYQASFTRLNQDVGIVTRMGLLSRLTLREQGTTGNYEASGTRVSGEILGRNKSGYAVSVLYDPGASAIWSLEIRHFQPQTILSYEGDVLATADLTSAGLTVGAAFTLDVETRNFDGDQLGEGTFVAIIAKVDGVQITPAPENIAGVQEQDNFLIDTRSEATGTRGAAGIFFTAFSLSATGDLVAAGTFQAQDLSDPPVLRPDEQASVSVAAEASGASGSLTVPLGATVQEEVKPAFWKHTFESGKQQTIANQAMSRRVWQVSAVMEPAQYESLTSLLGTNGSHTPFSWQHPYTRETHAVLFGQDQIEFRENGAQGYGYNASFELIEVFTQQTFNPEL